MNNPTKSSKPSDPKGRQSIKALFVTASLAATLGGWATLAAERAPVSQATPVPIITAPRPTAAAIKLEFAPLPTLVPAPTGVAALPLQPILVESQPTPLPQPTMRVVSQVPAQRVVVVGGGGGGGGGGSSPQPAAQSRSSK